MKAHAARGRFLAMMIPISCLICSRRSLALCGDLGGGAGQKSQSSPVVVTAIGIWSWGLARAQGGQTESAKDPSFTVQSVVLIACFARGPAH